MHIPKPGRGRRLTDALARRLPFGSDRRYVSLWVEVRDVTPSVQRVVPWLALFVHTDLGCNSYRLFRLPGSKIAELWDFETDEWLEYQP